jgi:pSer/pThr/pTyr-binding forkhead associated (FHA) protein
MWLLKAVGVHDQHGEIHPTRVGSQAENADFTFALERGRSYTIGRDKGCDIQFNSKRLRTHEGKLEIGDWSLAEVSSTHPAPG